ncbi:MAG: CHAT domain-containing protein [Synechococcus sp.]
MSRYYQRLRRGEGRAEALAATQAEFRRDQRYQHVYYWGAFQLSGDWRPLPGW